MAEGAGFSGRYANKPLPDVSGVRFGLKLLPASAGIIVVGESLPMARRNDERKRFGLLLTALLCRRHVEGSARAEEEYWKCVFVSAKLSGRAIYRIPLVLRSRAKVTRA